MMVSSRKSKFQGHYGRKVFREFNASCFAIFQFFQINARDHTCSGCRQAEKVRGRMSHKIVFLFFPCLVLITLTLTINLIARSKTATWLNL